MADDFGLLFQSVAVEAATRLDAVGVAAKRVAHQRQVKAAAFLRLPDMGHFVQEQRLEVDRGLGEIVAIPR